MTSKAGETPIALYLDEAIKTRHSTRAFKSDPIPPEILEECFSIAQLAPSNSNTQPWRATVVSDAALKRLSDVLLAANMDPEQNQHIKPLPQEYNHYRSELGHQLYGKDGYDIPREAKERLLEAMRRNYKFFDAPTAIILSVDRTLPQGALVSAGMWLQTLILLLQERGIGNCIEVSVAEYPEVIRKELGITENMNVLCGVAIGYADEDHKINHIKSTRDEWKKVVHYMRE